MNYRFVYTALFLHMFFAQTRCDDIHNMHNVHDGQAASRLAEQYAAYLTGQHEVARSRPIIDDGDQRQNPLKDDPEQQREHSADMCARMDRHVHFIEKAIQEGPEGEALDVYEQACRVIIKTLLKEVAHGNTEALGQVKKCVEVVAHIALLRDPFWALMLEKIKAHEDANVVVYATEELDESLPQNMSASHARLLELIEQIEQEKKDFSDVQEDDLDALAKQLELGKKELAKRMLHLLDNFAAATQAGTKMYQPPIAQKAKDLYNQAAINEVKTIVQFKENKKKRAYLEFEAAFRAIALTYMKAHDLGHPSALKDAEMLMNSGVMDKIVNWKQKHKLEAALDSYAAVWAEINKRKFKNK